jgi:hypothetical protein
MPLTAKEIQKEMGRCKSTTNRIPAYAAGCRARYHTLRRLFSKMA